jgi:hypothetical protein
MRGGRGVWGEGRLSRGVQWVGFLVLQRMFVL